MRGKLIIISAPSGTGKSTIIGWLMKEHPELNLAFSISCTSRAPRGTEQDGVEYFFLTPEEFRQRIDNDEFLESQCREIGGEHGDKRLEGILASNCSSHEEEE